MASQLNPLLLELFESVCRDLAKALETRERLSDLSDVAGAAQRERIATLEAAMVALGGALDWENGVVH